jgi:hypothetical protein
MPLDPLMPANPIYRQRYKKLTDLIQIGACRKENFDVWATQLLDYRRASQVLSESALLIDR